MKQPAALPLSGSGAGAGSCRNQREFSSAGSVLPKPGSETRLPGDTFLCQPAVSPACHATEPAGAAVQRVQPPPSWTFKGSCWGACCRRPPSPPSKPLTPTRRAGAGFPPASPHDRGLQPLYKPLSAAGSRREFSLCPLPSRLTRTPGCHSRRGLFPAPQPPACVGFPGGGGTRCHVCVPPSPGKGLPSLSPKARAVGQCYPAPAPR